MISELEASKELKRLAGLNFYPREREALLELRLAAQVAASVEVLRAVVDDWLAEETESPKPADVRRLLASRHDQQEQRRMRPDPECVACDGSGWRQQIQGLYSGVMKCRCWAPRVAAEFRAVPLIREPDREATLRRVAELAEKLA